MKNSEENDHLNCEMVGKCGGCPWGDRALAAQIEEKTARVRGIFPTAEIVYQPLSRVRDRADLVWERRSGQLHLGLYALGSREIVDLPGCPMMSHALEAWFLEYRKLEPPIDKGSVRLRVSPAGERGVWLDFANQDVKTLFEEQTYLQRLSALASVVEIGQRRKHLVWRYEKPKLVDPVLKPWFETYNADFAPIPLYGPVGGFTQTGFAANRALVSAVCAAAEASGVREWLELFCGNGNFALALASRGHSVEAVELDELALEGLALSAAQAGCRIQTQRADVYLKTKTLPPLAGRGLLVDPPRAGLREVLAQLRSGPLPSALLYVSCFTDVFLRETEQLKEIGFELVRLSGVDQFPHSPHNEWIGLFKSK